jgi:hypothetical protein
MVYRSVSRKWDGFLNLPHILQSDWTGFVPGQLDDEYTRRPIIVVTSKACHGGPSRHQLQEFEAENV